MINLHVYPSPFTHESRILRESAVIAERARFDQVVLVGTGALELAAVERLDSRREIRRFERGAGVGLLGKSFATLAWSRRVLQAYASQPIACVNCHSLPVLPLCALLAARTGASLIYDAHELETETQGLSGLRQLVSRLVERSLIHRADAMIVVGEAIADWYQREYSMERPTVVLNCPDRSSSGRADLLRTRLGISASQRIFLCQGLLAAGRGVEMLCEAWSKLSGPRPALVFMGNGPLEGLVEGVARRDPDVWRIPSVPPEDVLAYTGSADVGLCLVQATCLSYSLCMPNKLFEYLHAGLPVIVSNLPELSRVVRETAVGRVVASNDAASVAASVREMNGADLDAFASPVAAARRVYNWPAQADKLAALYQRLGFLLG
jgi:glycosyltransferase involved in cell wall biosynthesis